MLPPPPDQLRMRVRNGASLLVDAGWHFSHLVIDEAAVRAKIWNFAHQKYNTPALLDGPDIQALIVSGRDLYGGLDCTWRVIDKAEAPRWLSGDPVPVRSFV